MRRVFDNLLRGIMNPAQRNLLLSFISKKLGQHFHSPLLSHQARSPRTGTGGNHLWCPVQTKRWLHIRSFVKPFCVKRRKIKRKSWLITSMSTNYRTKHNLLDVT